ncbi:LLM class flavin-dependent oxidoreductase [Candidatus Bathyarchaeota archaeon]|nr:LLM class flavin-dependent oxidoreductase [Candidatus Bathyarchaeota archaeon]MBS7614004.1 LLM class flavin-dependent oxidoreductase [Candidatus Bathyarchaeota archaeon]
MAVRFGVYLPTFSRVRTGRELWNMCLESALTADKFGFTSIWAPDHLLGFDSVERVGEPSIDMLESFTTMAALAQATKNVRVGFSVLCLPFRNPALTAKMAATLDVISNGRLLFGLGAGWREDEFKSYGYTWRPLKERLEESIEAAEVIKRCWTMDKVYFKGRYYNIDGCEVKPKPLQKPTPPIWFGGVGLKAIEGFIRINPDGWLSPPLRLEDLKYRIDVFHMVDKGLTIAMEMYTSIDETSDKALEKARRPIEKWFGDPAEKVADYDASVQLPGGVTVRYGVTIGSPNDCIDVIARYVEVGVSHFVLHFMPLEDTVEGLKMYAEKVIPYFSESC